MSARVSRTKLAAALLDYVAAKGTSPKQLQKIAAYLVDQKRTKELDSLMRDMMKRREANGHLELTVVSKSNLSPEAKKQLKQLFPAKKHIINEVQDPNVLGGVLVETADAQLDLTVASKIQQLRSAS